MPRRDFNKLVWDRVPEIIEANGSTCSVVLQDDQDFSRALCAKLVEEATEASASDRDLATELPICMRRSTR